jgi:hypothetical protein
VKTSKPDAITSHPSVRGPDYDPPGKP